MSALDAVSETKYSAEEIEQRIVRFNEMVPCTTAFIDARTPGSDKKENFCLIGEGVAENPDQVVHIDIPHGFNIGAARQPKGCKNSHHSHDTEEIFMIFSGEWLFTWGEEGQDGQVVLQRGDTISLPKHMFRGFENIGDEEAFMFSILGLDESGSAGHVVWAPYVFRDAKNHGLVLLEDGRLIDVAAGHSIPSDGVEQAATSAEQVAALASPSIERMNNCVARQDELDSLATGGLSNLDGVTEFAVIGVENDREDIGKGQMDWTHNFQLRRLQIEAGRDIPTHFRAEEEVLIIYSGELDVVAGDRSFTLGAGDLFSVPIGLERAFRNSTNQMTDVIVVRRGNQPLAAQFVNTGT